MCRKLPEKLKEEIALLISGDEPNFLSAGIFGVLRTYLELGFASVLPSLL